MSKKRMIYGIVGTFSVLLILLGSSYAFWFISKEQTDKNIVSTDCFQIEFFEGESVVLNNAYPVSDEEGIRNPAYSFKLKNICDSYASYQINLETMMQNSEVKVLPDMYVKAGIQENNKVSVNHKLSSDIEVEKTIEGATKAYQLLTGTLRKNETKEFKLRLWMDYDTPPSDDSMNASYKGKVSIITTYKADQFVKSGTLMLQNENEAFWQKDYRENIKTIVIESVMNPHETREELIFDVSHNQDKSVMAYLVLDDIDEGKYTLYLQSIGGVKANPNSKDLFKNFISTVEIQGMENFDTSNVTNMYSIFEGMAKLSSLDVSYMDTSNVTNMAFMFKNCNSLTHLDVSTFNTSNVTNMAYIFSGMENLEKLDISNFDTSSVTNMASMFQNCKSLTYIDVSNFNTSKVIGMASMFDGMSSLIELDISSFDTSNVNNMGAMFQGLNLTELDLSHFNTTSATNMSSMFFNMINLTNLDLSNFDTTNVTHMSGMFHNCKSLTNLDLHNFNTSKVTDMNTMFLGMLELTSLDISNFDTSNVTNMTHMFFNMINLTDLDVSNFDTSNVTNMASMFYGMGSLEDLDISNFDTSKVTTMWGMFSNCKSLTRLDLSHFNTVNVEYFVNTFYNMKNLEYLNISNFDTHKVVDYFGMFNGSSKLTNIVYGNQFIYANNAKVEVMFDQCPANKPTYESWNGIF